MAIEPTALAGETMMDDDLGTIVDEDDDTEQPEESVQAVDDDPSEDTDHLSAEAKQLLSQSRAEIMNVKN